MSERKHAAFRKVAASRTNEVLYRIERLKRCANRASYAWTADDVNAIVGAIEAATSELRAEFMPPSTRAAAFAFDDEPADAADEEAQL
jgi:hypothetical protein